MEEKWERLTDGWIQAHFTNAHRLLLIIFRAHRRNTHPVVATGLSLNLLAPRTWHLLYQTHTPKEEIGYYKKSYDYLMSLCEFARERFISANWVVLIELISSTWISWLYRAVFVIAKRARQRGAADYNLRSMSGLPSQHRITYWVPARHFQLHFESRIIRDEMWNVSIVSAP